MPRSAVRIWGLVLAGFSALLVAPLPGAARQFSASGQIVNVKTPPGVPSTIPLSGNVAQTGSVPATLTLPSRLGTRTLDFKVPIPSPSLFQTEAMMITYPQAGTFSSGAGPGDFAWCPGQPNLGCGGAQTAPPRRQRIRYIGGPNRFGGSLAVLHRGRRGYSRASGGGALHSGIIDPPLGGGRTGDGTLTSGTGAVQVGFAMSTVLRLPVVLTAGAIFGPLGTIQTPGTFVTSVGSGGTSIATSFGWTTGTVRLSSASPGGVITRQVSISGYDNRTALGAGNIQLVAGSLGQTVAWAGTTGFRTLTMTVTLAPAVPSLSPLGLAAAAALILLAVGYAFRGRG